MSGEKQVAEDQKKETQVRSRRDSFEGSHQVALVRSGTVAIWSCTSSLVAERATAYHIGATRPLDAQALLRTMLHRDYVPDRDSCRDRIGDLEPLTTCQGNTVRPLIVSSSCEKAIFHEDLDSLQDHFRHYSVRAEDFTHFRPHLAVNSMELDAGTNPSQCCYPSLPSNLLDAR